MHTIVDEDEGWELELLSDDSDEECQNIENKLNGCCSIKEVKEKNGYVAEIRYEERRHDELVYVGALVFKGRKKYDLNREDVLFFKRRTYQGKDCKKKAASYAKEIKRNIESLFFS